VYEITEKFVEQLALKRKEIKYL